MKTPVILAVRRDDEFSRTLRKNGCEVINLELIRTEPVADLSGLDEKLARPDEYDGIFITSRRAAEIFVDRPGLNFGGKIYVLGERSRKVLENAGLKVVFSKRANTAEELINSFDAVEFSGKKLLFVRGNRARRTVPEMIGGIAQIDEVEVYRTVENPVEEKILFDVRERLRRGEIDWICFFSPSGVESFVKLFDVSDAKVAVIGTTTAEAAKEVSLNTQLVSPNATSEDFALSLINELFFAV